MLSNGRFAGFRSHPKLEGSHAYLSASKYHWVNYPDKKLIDGLSAAEAAARGTRLHAWAAEAIELERRQPENHDALSDYVNDALDYGLTPEQLLFYSIHAFGTADTIGFEEYINPMQYLGFLRIHDLKTGISKASFEQLYIYAAFFCLEYDFLPYEIEGELRIYQGKKQLGCDIDQGHLAHVYDRTKHANSVVERHRKGGLI